MRFCTYSCIILAAVVVDVVCLYDPSRMVYTNDSRFRASAFDDPAYRINSVGYPVLNDSSMCSALDSHGVDMVCTYREKVVSCQFDIMPGTTATLACKNTYKTENIDRIAYSENTCLDGGVWDHPPFRCIPECGVETPHGRILIINGFTAERGVFPWHVAVYENYTTGSYDQVCGGSLISSNLIISAAHCFYDETIQSTRRASDFAIAAGKRNRLYNWPEKFVQKASVEQIYISERYYGIPGNYAVDIALVRVQTPFDLNALIKPICVDWENIYETQHLQAGSVGKVVGWGKTAQGEPSAELQEINLPYISHGQCISAVPVDFRGFITPDKFCAGYLNGSSPCNGDSGGGLGFKTDKLWYILYLRGIVSSAPSSQDMCDSRYYTAFTNVGHYITWIREVFTTSS